MYADCNNYCCYVSILTFIEYRWIEKSSNVYNLQYEGLLKPDRPGCHTKYLELRACPPDRRLCVITVLKDYLKRTSNNRKDCTYLFVSYGKPHNRVCRDTISRWLKSWMSKAGIDIKKFSSNSIRIWKFLANKSVLLEFLSTLLTKGVPFSL